MLLSFYSKIYEIIKHYCNNKSLTSFLIINNNNNNKNASNI